MATLEEMQIGLDGIGHALADNLLSVPVYQRSYAWEGRHVTDLFRDIGSALHKREHEYFLGSIVVTRRTADRPEVVDGQQRLATTTILIAAVRDWFFDQGDSGRVTDIEREFLVTRDLRTQEVAPRLRLNEVDADFFSRRVLSAPGSEDRSLEPTRESHRRIAHAVALAREHVNGIARSHSESADVLIDWIDYLRTSVKVIWVSVPDYANAFTIFETLNDRGLDLAISDLLKNHLFHLSGNRLKETQQRWVAMAGALEAAGADTVLADYIRHLWSSIHGATREKDLYDETRRHLTSKQAAVGFATDLMSNSRIYAAILNPEHELWKEYGTTAREHMSTINLLRMVQIRPLLLAVLSKFSAQEVKKSLGLMVTWGVRFLVSGGLGGGTLERHYSDRAKEVRGGKLKTAKSLLDAMRSVVPSDSQFEASFSTATVSTTYLARYYLRALEKQRRGEANPELVPNPNEEVVNLEHVLPEHPDDSWSNVDEETASAYYRRIGNLALMKTKVNSDIGNVGFAEKRKAYKLSGFELTSSLATYRTWGPAEIGKRQQELAKLAVLAWPNKVIAS